MKKKIFVLLLAVCMLFSTAPVLAAEQRVFDYAELLSETEEQDIQYWIEDMQLNWDMDLAYLTTNDLEGKDIREYGAEFYIAHDLGMGENYDGVIFVLDMGSREGQIITSGKAIKIFTDYYIDAMWDNMVDYLSAGDYYSAFYSLYADMSYYQQEYVVYQKDPDSYLSDYSEHQMRQTFLTTTAVAAVFSLVIAALAVHSMKKKCKNVRPYTDGRAYLKENGFQLSVNRDSFATTHTSMMPIPKDDDNHHHGGGMKGGGSWGGRSSTFSSGGRSFGGGGGKF